jgi:hypothetical protein
MKNNSQIRKQTLSWERRHPVCFSVRDQVARRQDACAPSVLKMKNNSQIRKQTLSWERRHPVCLSVRDQVAGRQDACAPSVLKMKNNSQIAQITQMVKPRGKRPGCKEYQTLSGVFTQPV